MWVYRILSWTKTQECPEENRQAELNHRGGKRHQNYGGRNAVGRGKRKVGGSSCSSLKNPPQKKKLPRTSARKVNSGRRAEEQQGDPRRMPTHRRGGSVSCNLAAVSPAMTERNHSLWTRKRLPFCGQDPVGRSASNRTHTSQTLFPLVLVSEDGGGVPPSFLSRSPSSYHPTLSCSTALSGSRLLESGCAVLQACPGPLLGRLIDGRG